MNTKKKILIYLIGSLVVFMTFMTVSTDLFAQEGGAIRQKVEEALSSPSGDTTERLAEIGKPAVPLLLEILKGNEFPEYKFTIEVVEALGIIGDERATPILLEMLEEDRVKQSGADQFFIIAALAGIGDPAAEPAVLDFFEELQTRGSQNQLEAAHYLLKVGGESSRQKVKEMVAYVRDLYERGTWIFDEADSEEVFKELESSPFYNEEIVYALLPGLIIDLGDAELLTRAIQYRQLADETGPRYKDGFEVLAETDTPEAIEAIFKFAENNKEIWPPAPPGATEEQYREVCQVAPLIRVAAVETLLTISGVDTDRVIQAFEDIPTEELREIPLTIKLQPDKWNYQWKKTKDKQGEGKITSYLGNIPGDYSVRDILPETIRLNGKITPSKKGKKEKIQTKIKKHHKGFIGEVLEVKFNKFETIKSIESIWPGKECDITITGRLSDDMPFKGSYRIKIKNK